MKNCYKCNTTKEFSKFSKKKSNKDGLNNWRKECNKEYLKNYYSENKEELLDYKKDHYLNNKEIYLEKSKRWKEENKVFYLECLKQWRNENPEYNKEYLKEWYLSNEGERSEYYQNNRLNNPHIVAWRTVLKNAIQRINTKKSNSTIEMLGYSSNDLETHLESLFTDGMSWENWGDWHIDHKIPVSKFDKETPMSIVNSLDNLQPLWALDNLSKSNKIEND